MTRCLVLDTTQVINDVDDQTLPFFRYVTGYVVGKGVQQTDTIDNMVRQPRPLRR